jgi:hypothetical protein
MEECAKTGEHWLFLVQVSRVIVIPRLLLVMLRTPGVDYNRHVD